MVQGWLDGHPRSRLESDALSTYAGQPAVRSRVVDASTGRVAVLFLDPEMPRLLALHEE
jgi:hypothetical protein